VHELAAAKACLGWALRTKSLGALKVQRSFARAIATSTPLRSNNSLVASSRVNEFTKFPETADLKSLPFNIKVFETSLYKRKALLYQTGYRHRQNALQYHSHSSPEGDHRHHPAAT
jgi:hypothetical protein